MCLGTNVYRAVGSFVFWFGMGEICGQDFYIVLAVLELPI